jgi:hypothetical protein
MAFSALFLLISSKKKFQNFQIFFISNVIRCYKVEKTNLCFPDDVLTRDAIQFDTWWMVTSVFQVHKCSQLSGLVIRKHHLSFCTFSHLIADIR